jgi:hypothetical protein
VRARADGTADVDVLHRELLAAGERLERVRAVLQSLQPDETLLLSVLRRAVPVKLLECLAGQPPWSETPRLLGGIVLNPRAPRALALRLLSSLLWRDLAEAARSHRLSAAIRFKAEAQLAEQLPGLRKGDRVTLARLATPAVLRQLLSDAEPRVVRASLANPRLRESDLVQALQKDTVTVVLIREVAASRRWAESYAVKLALALQSRTPLGIALAQLTSLLPGDLRRIAESESLPPLVQASALRVARGQNPRP